MSPNNKPQANPDPSLKQLAETRLNERGILDSASSAGWRLFTFRRIPGWSYPIFDPISGEVYCNPRNGKPVLRWKNFDKIGQGGSKYGWPFGQKGCPPYYVLPGTKEAIAAAGGLAYIAAGEVDLLTYVSAGMPNVICWLNGEASVPDDLADIAAALGISKLVYFIDRDATGEKSANLTARQLTGTNIEVSAYRLPSYLGDKGDINDLWKWVGFDSTRFVAVLEDIMADRRSALAFDPHDVDSQVEDPTSAQDIALRPRTVMVDWEAERSEWIRTELMPLLDQVAPVARREGRIERRHCPNPKHADEHPSFRISYDLDTVDGIPQCSCGVQHERHSWDLVAGWVGAQPFMEWWKANSSQRSTISQPTASASQSDYQLDRQGENLEMSELSTGINTTEPKGKRPAPTDDVIASRLINCWEGNRAYFLGCWHVYSNGVWTPEENIKRLIWQAMEAAKAEGYKPSKTKADSIEACLIAKLYVVSQVDMEADRYINLKNGIYDLSGVEGALLDHQRDFYLTTQMRYSYEPNAECPRWMQFLREVCVRPEGEPDEQLINLLQEAFGYSLTADTYLEACFWLHGQAASGKSTVLNVLRTLLGSAFISMDLNMLEANQYQLANLPGKRVVACSEAKVNSRLADSILKALVSGEELTVRQIYGEPFNYKPIAKIWWAMNEQPQNLDRSNAIYRRLKIMPFNNPRSLNAQDRLLSSKLTSELPGIFNWALEGLRRLRLNGSFTKVDQVEAAIQEYKADNDTEAVFLNDVEWCCLDEQAQTQASDLYIA